MADQVLMEKAGEQMNVSAEKVEHFRLLGWKEAVVQAQAPIERRDPFTAEQRKEIAKIVAAELIKSSLEPAEVEAIKEAKKLEEKTKAAEEKAAKEATAAAEKAAKEAAAAEKKAAKEAAEKK